MVLFLSVPVPVTMRSSNKLYHPNRCQTASIYSIWLVRCLSSPPAPVSRCYSFTSSKKKADPIIILSTIYIIRIYSYCHEQNHPRFRLTVKSSLVSSCEDIFFLHFLLSFGHLAKIRSVIWPRSVRSFGQVSFGRLTKFHSVVWPNQHVTSVILPNPSLQIGFRCPYM